MKKLAVVTLMIVAVAGFAAAQLQAPQSDVLGAHLNWGRGCAACHAPHSGAYGNGAAKTADATSGDTILWGQDVASLYSKPLTFVGGVQETLPASMTATTPDVSGLLTCLSCHDGNYAVGAMMKDKVYEGLPAGYGSYNNIPTLLGNDPTGAANGYLNDHPVGLNAIVGCGGAHNWDCSVVNGAISMNGTNSKAFVTNYGFFVSIKANGANPTVMCTTCHNQHLMNVVSVTSSKSGQTPGFYATMFFVRGPYNPASGTAGSNQTAQFCRECHGGEANEMNGTLTLGTVF